MLSRYTEFTPLGQGGMGVVYRATDTQLHRQVALKFVTARFGSEDQARARFLREARMAAALNHPAICTIYEVGEIQSGEERMVAPDSPFAPGTPFIAMELIEGKALDAILRGRGRLTPDDLLDIAIPIAEALAAAHAKGVVHRDLKPANVMITPEGRPKILDFGLAKLVDAFGDEAATTTETESADLTRRGQVLGTIAYMSPEQAQGKPVDSRSDIFSFGVMLYELAAGERPFCGDTPTSTLAKILETEPKPLGDVRSDLPGELLRIVRRCLRKKPEERFQSTGDLVVALKELKRDTASGPAQGWSDAVPAVAGVQVPVSRRPTARTIVLLGAAAVAVAGAWFGMQHLRPPTAVPLPQALPTTLTQRLLLSGDEVGLYLAALSPDGKYLAYTGLGAAYVREIATGTTRPLPLRSGDSARRPAWAPDGVQLYIRVVAAKKSALWLVSVLTGEARWLLDDVISGPWPSPAGDLIAFRRMKDTTDELWIAGAHGESPRKIHSLPPGSSFADVAWAPNGGWLAVFRNGRTDAVLEIFDREGVQGSDLLSDLRLRMPFGGTSDLTWLPDGRLLFSLTEPPPSVTDMNIWSLAIDLAAYPVARSIARLQMFMSVTLGGGSVNEKSRRPSGSQVRSLVPPNGGWLAVFRNGRTDAVLEIFDREGVQGSDLLSDLRLRMPFGGTSDLTWLPDGRLLFSLTEPPPSVTDMNIWSLAIDLATGYAASKPVRITNVSGAEITPLGVSADGKRLLASRRTSQMDTYVGDLSRDGARLSVVRKLTMSNANDRPEDWTPDGRLLLWSDRNGSGNLFIQSLDSREPTGLVTGAQSIFGGQVTPEGDAVLYAVEDSTGRPPDVNTIFRRDLATGTTRLLGKFPTRTGIECRSSVAPSCVSWRVEGDALHITIYDFDSGQGREIARIPWTYSDYPQVAVSRDGVRVSVFLHDASGEDGIRIIEISGGQVRQIKIKGVDSMQQSAFTADGRALLLTNQEAGQNGLFRVEFDGRATVLRRTETVGEWMGTIVPSPDGRHLAFSTISFGSDLWLLENF